MKYLAHRVFMCLALSVASLAHAASWPSKPINLVVAFAPGGNTDMVARILGEGLAKELGQSVVVINKPGATGLIGTNYVADATPDGYTYLVNVTGLVISPHVSASVPEDLPMRLAPVSQISAIPKALVVNADLPVNTFEELLAYSKKKPGGLSYGSSGIGSGNHLTGELVAMLTKQPMVHVTYSGSMPALMDLLGGRIDIVFDDLPVVLPFIKEGRLKALLTLSKARNPELPDVPSVGELGMDDLIIEPWNGVMAPKGVPPEIIQAMDTAIRKVVAGEQYQAQMKSKGLMATYRNAQDYGEFIAAEYQRWGDVVKKAGIPRQ